MAKVCLKYSWRKALSITLRDSIILGLLVFSLIVDTVTVVVVLMLIGFETLISVLVLSVVYGAMLLIVFLPAAYIARSYMCVTNTIIEYRFGLIRSKTISVGQVTSVEVLDTAKSLLELRVYGLEASEAKIGVFKCRGGGRADTLLVKPTKTILLKLYDGSSVLIGCSSEECNKLLKTILELTIS